MRTTLKEGAKTMGEESAVVGDDSLVLGEESDTSQPIHTGHRLVDDALSCCCNLDQMDLEGRIIAMTAASDQLSAVLTTSPLQQAPIPGIVRRTDNRDTSGAVPASGSETKPSAVPPTPSGATPTPVTPKPTPAMMASGKPHQGQQHPFAGSSHQSTR